MMKKKLKDKISELRLNDACDIIFKNVIRKKLQIKIEIEK